VAGNDELAARGAALIDVLLIVGIVCAIILVDKIGSIRLTAFLFPLLLADIGTQALLFILVGTSLIGAVVTWLFRIETTGVNLEQIGN
jgi:hypothetical protein